MKTDSFFYGLFSEFPDAFFILIGLAGRQIGKYRFASEEVKDQAFRFDGLFIPEAVDDFLYFVETQFKKDDDFYARFFGEIFVYLRQKQPASNWRAVVFFPNESADPGVQRHYEEFFQSGRLQRIYLSALPREVLQKFPLNLLRIIFVPEQNVAATVKEIVRQLPKEIHDEKEQETIIQLLVNLLLNKLPKLSFEEIMKMVEPMLSDIKKSRAYQEIAQEGRIEKAREIAKSLLLEKMRPDFILKVTGLTHEELLAISKELDDRKN